MEGGNAYRQTGAEERKKVVRKRFPPYISSFFPPKLFSLLPSMTAEKKGHSRMKKPMKKSPFLPEYILILTGIFLILYVEALLLPLALRSIIP